MEVGRLACGHLLAQSKRPTAILCSNDMTAIGVMRKCYEDGIAIPRDLSVVGFDDIRLAQFMLPPLTRSEEHTSELQSQSNLVCRLLLEKKKMLQPAVRPLAQPHLDSLHADSLHRLEPSAINVGGRVLVSPARPAALLPPVHRLAPVELH